MTVTERLYYLAADVRDFDATVTACEATGDGRSGVLLDRTAFYPTSGGQPFDTGSIGGVAVLEVVDRDDGEIAHVIEGALAVGSRVRGEIDWARRFDHMQQHTGQHVLSAAFDRVANAPTVSFHLGAAASTIDLGREVGAGEIAEAEAEANRVVWDDRAVTVRFVSAEEAAGLPLRKESKRTGPLRLVEVADFDLSACGGTHVPRTGVIGMIGISGWERFKSGTRVTFVCGQRALQSHRRLRDAVASVGRQLSVAPGEFDAAIERLRDDNRQQARRLVELGGELVEYQSVELRSRAETIGPFRVVLTADPAADAGQIKALAQALVRGESGLVAVMAGSGVPMSVVAARSEGVAFDAGAFIRTLTSRLGGRGGGRPELAQGGVTADREQVLATAREILEGRLM